MEVIEEFIHFSASNCSTELYQNSNTASNFTILLEKPMYFEKPEEWQVGLLHIFLPKLYFNIYEPFNRNIFEIRRFEDADDHVDKSAHVCTVHVDPGFYTVKDFCDAVNNTARKCLINSLKKSVKKDEDGNYYLAEEEEGSVPKKFRRHDPTHEDATSSNKTKVHDLVKDIENPEHRKAAQEKYEQLGIEPKQQQQQEVSELVDDGEKQKTTIRALSKRSIHREGISVETWNSTTEKLKSFLLPKINEGKPEFDLMRVKPNSNKLKINVLPKHFYWCKNLRMQKLLGWCQVDNPLSSSSSYIVKAHEEVPEKEIEVDISETSAIYANLKANRILHMLLPFTADFGRDNRALWVYTNIIRPSRVGNALAPILRIIDLNAADIDKQVIVREYDAPVFFPIKGQMIDKIEFRLCNGLGDDFPFQSGEHSIIALKFQRRVVKQKSH